MRIAICDDDVLHNNFCAEQLKELKETVEFPVLIKQYFSSKELLFEWESPIERAQVLYIGILLEFIDGITAVRQLREMGYRGEVIFVTRSKEHFPAAFDLHAFNYILKSEMTRERFEKAFLDVTKHILEKDIEDISFTRRGETINILVRDIIYFESNKNVVRVRYNDEEFEFYSTISKLENVLSEKKFLRIHKSYLVSMGFVSQITKKNIVLKNGEVLPLGKTYYRDIMERLKEMTDHCL